MRKNVRFFFYLRYDGYRRSKGVAPIILNLDTRWMCVVNFTRRPLYSQERTPLPTEQGVGWASELAWKFWRREKSFFFFPSGIRTPHRPAHAAFTMPTEPLRLLEVC